MTDLVSIDVGYGVVKVARKSQGKLSLTTFPTAIAEGKPLGHVYDPNLIEFEGAHYYLFQDAIKSGSGKVGLSKDFNEYLRIAPLLIKEALRRLRLSPKKIAVGLSIAYVGRSGEFLIRTSEILQIPKQDIILIPQGAGSKIAYDRFGSKLELDLESDSIVEPKLNYLGVDIGYNTVDVYKVINGSMSSEVSEGIEGQGALIISNKTAELLKSKYQIIMDSEELKDVIRTCNLKFRGSIIDLKAELRLLATEYLTELLGLIESKFQNSIDRLDGIVISGGGAAIFTNLVGVDFNEELLGKYPQGFIEICDTKPEFYNSVGFLLHLLKTVK